MQNYRRLQIELSRLKNQKNKVRSENGADLAERCVAKGILFM